MSVEVVLLQLNSQVTYLVHSKHFLHFGQNKLLGGLGRYTQTHRTANGILRILPDARVHYLQHIIHLEDLRIKGDNR